MTPMGMAITAVGLLVAGIVLLLAGESTAVEATGWALVGFAGVLAVSAIFLAIGLSEDRDRARRPHG